MIVREKERLEDKKEEGVEGWRRMNRSHGSKRG